MSVYINFDSQQFVYEDGDNIDYFPPTLNDDCFSRHLLINKYLSTKKPKYLFWSLERDINVLMDPFFVETITYWTNLNINQSSNNITNLINNISASIKNSRNNQNYYHYDTGLVHSYVNNDSPIITFETHPPRRCSRVVDTFDQIKRELESNSDDLNNLKKIFEKNYGISNIKIQLEDIDLMAADLFLLIHDSLKKVDPISIKITPRILLKIVDDARSFLKGLNYIIDTFRIVDYWDPDKKR